MTTIATSLVRSSSATSITEVLSSGSTYTLPAVIPIGTIFEVINTQTAVDVDIKSSNGTTLETIRNGICRLIALQTNPTTSAHWRILHLYEDFNTTLTADAGTTWTNGPHNVLLHITRVMKQVIIRAKSDSNVYTVAVGSSSISISAMPLRFLRPINFTATLRTICTNAGALTLARAQINNSYLQWIIEAGGNFSGVAGVGNFSNGVTSDITYTLE